MIVDNQFNCTGIIIAQWNWYASLRLSLVYITVSGKVRPSDHNLNAVTAAELASSQEHNRESTVQPSVTFDHEVCNNFNLSTMKMARYDMEQRNVETFLNTLHTVIPAASDFSPEFHNPCWNMHIADPSELRKLLKKVNNFTDQQAALMLSYAMSSSPRQHLVCLPKIFLIGFPRSGSTQLYQMLVKHRDVVPGLRKELHWWSRFPFNGRFPHNILAVLKYLLYFSSASKFISTHPQALTIDGSQSTIWDTRVLENPCIMPSLLSSIVPNAKYIVIMREPVERLYSDFLYMCRVQLNDADPMAVLNKSQLVANIPKVFHKVVQLQLKKFNTCLQKYPLEVCTELALNGSANLTSAVGEVPLLRLGISLYYVHVAKWLRVVSREQMLFLRTEDLEKCPYSLLQRVWQFVQVPYQSPYELADVLFGHANSNQNTVTNGIRMLPETRVILREFFQPFNKQLAALLGDRKFLWDDV